MIKDKAVEYFKNGYSCSESIIMACAEEGLCGKELVACATPFSGGMSSGCVCGAVSGAQIVLGHLFGRDNKLNNPVCAREKAAALVEEFKKKNKVTCCRVLSAGLTGTERKAHCSEFVTEVSDILEELTKVKV